VDRSGHPQPDVYGDGPLAYRHSVARETSTRSHRHTVELHAPITVEAMRAGKYAAVEVPCALSLEDAGPWSTRTSRPACPA